MPPPRPVLLVFTLAPERECGQRPLLPARLRRDEVALRRECLDAAVEAGREAGCRTVVSTPDDLPLPADVERMAQPGSGFGERLRRALAGATREGAPTVVVGGDVPGLTGGHVRTALELLDRRPEAVAVGPSPDGGFYLLASRRPLDRELAEVAWCRRTTLASLLAALRRASREVALLPPLADLDRRADVESWLARARRSCRRWTALVRRLLAALADERRPAVPLGVTGPRRAPVPVPPGRAPPALRRRPRR